MKTMMHAIRYAILCLLPVLGATAAADDDRIRELDYDPKAVVRLDGCFGFQTMVQFAPGEKIENVGIGDASRWLVVPNKRADILFVKPAYPSSHSNMTVSTDRRRYNFELIATPTDACRRGRVVYTLQFRYPADDAAPQPPVAIADVVAAETDAPVPEPASRNSAYTFSGARGNVPQRVFDDGQRTYFRWADGSATPAVHAVGADRSETPVDFTQRGDYLVIDRVAPAFVLRSGNTVAVLYNDAYRIPSLDETSPHPRVDADRPLSERQARKDLSVWLRDKEATP